MRLVLRDTNLDDNPQKREITIQHIEPFANRLQFVRKGGGEVETIEVDGRGDFLFEGQTWPYCEVREGKAESNVLPENEIKECEITLRFNANISPDNLGMLADDLQNCLEDIPKMMEFWQGLNITEVSHA